jgi:subtilisin family serine protease
MDFSVEYRPLQDQICMECVFDTDEAWIALNSASGREYEADVYVRYGPDTAYFLPGSRDPNHMIGSPGAASGAITVGSYDWNDRFRSKSGGWTLRDVTIGELSDYSSPGYLRADRAIKPDVVGPGQLWAAPLSSDKEGVADDRMDATGRYQPFNGTSAATPYVAGVVALLLERRPRMTAREIRSALGRSASRDGFTRGLPNYGWGHGKLDLAAVRRLLSAP